MKTTLRARIRAGDLGAFEELFTDHAKPVYSHAFRLTGDWAAAEDIVAVTFLEAWRLRERVDPDGGSLRPWLLGIATNACRNSRRTSRRYDALLGKLPREQVVPDFADELAGQLDDARTIARVQTLLRKLRRTEREVVALCVWAGLDSAAAADALGIPVGTVRSRLSRARAKLRRLAGEDPAPAADTAPTTRHVPYAPQPTGPHHAPRGAAPRRPTRPAPNLAPPPAPACGPRLTSDPAPFAAQPGKDSR